MNTYFNNFPKLKIILIEFLKILGFGALSLLMGKIQFLIPGIEGGISDLREIALVISIFYFRHWIPFVLLSLITSIGSPTASSFASSFAMHSFSLVILFYSYKFLDKKQLNRFLYSGIWFFVVCLYYTVLLIPIMVISYFLMSRIQIMDLQANYANILVIIRFEMVSTAGITALYLLNLKTTALLEHQNHDLLKSKQKAEESEQLKTAFLQNLSHEIRTPLNGILGFSRLLQKNNCTEDQIQNYTQLIACSGDQLLNIVNDIIDASQIDTKQVELMLTQITISEIFRDVKNVIEAKGDAFVQRVNFNINFSNDFIVCTDTYKLTRIIYHLTDNALKFSGEKQVNVNFLLLNDSFELSVEDFGIGISSENSKEIFYKFRQLDSQLARSYGGNGLGLSIVKGFLTSLKGELFLTSEIGKGSTFRVRFPLSVAE